MISDPLISCVREQHEQLYVLLFEAFDILQVLSFALQRCDASPLARLPSLRSVTNCIETYKLYQIVNLPGYLCYGRWCGKSDATRCNQKSHDVPRFSEPRAPLAPAVRPKACFAAWANTPSVTCACPH